MGSPLFPEAPASIPPTSESDMTTQIARLQSQKKVWATMSIAGRIELLQEVAKKIQEQARGWAETSAQAKGFMLDDPRVGEEWLAGPYQVARTVRLLNDALKAGGQPQYPGKRTAVSGHTVVDTFPLSTLDKLMYGDIKSEVWLEKGAEPEQGFIYRHPEDTRAHPDGRVCLVLGAGNISCIGPQDVLDQLVIHNSVCLLKMNPVNEYAGPYIERAFKPLIDEGFMAVCYGGVEVGQFLTHHDDIEAIHITGSAATHDAIVWGVGEAQAKNKASGQKVIDKPISSELGAVTPLLVVPGPWTDAQIKFQATHIAGMISHNASFDCNAIKVLVTAKGWSLRERFLDAVADALKKTPIRKAYYPGAMQRYQAFLDEYEQAEVLTETADGVVPWTLIRDIPPEKGEYAFENEAFCGVLCETALEADDAVQFLERAIPFANDVMWGTLSCAILVHPETERQHGEQVEQALADLKYGGIGYNIWPGTIYGLVTTTWGAYPGHTDEDIQSGQGVVHNSFLFDHPLKSIVRAPFKIAPKPIWFPKHKTLMSMSERLTRFEYEPSYLKLPGIVWDALRG